MEKTKMKYINKDPNGPCCERFKLYGSFSLRDWLFTDGNTFYERDNWNPHSEDFDPWVYEEMKSTGWNMDYFEINNATFAVFWKENVVESLLSKEELQKLLPWLEWIN